MKHTLLITILILSVISSATAQDDRETVAVPLFENSVQKHLDSSKRTLDRYIPGFTAKVTEILKGTKRFVVVNRSVDQVEAERDFQSEPEFVRRIVESKKTGSPLDVSDIIAGNARYASIEMMPDATGTLTFRGANYIVLGEIRKIDINKMLNTDGSTSGYKALLGLQISLIDAETNNVIEAEGFQSIPLKTAMNSAARAVDEALMTMENTIRTYLLQAFPLKGRVVKITESGLVVNIGSNHGVRVGDRFALSVVEELEGESYEKQLGEAKVAKIAGPIFSDCNIIGNQKEVKEANNAGQTIKAILIKTKTK